MTIDAKNMRRLRTNRIARSQCTRCGKDIKDGYTQCEDCRDYIAEYKRKIKGEL